MNLTNRERLVILAALSYAYSNCDDLNDSMAYEGDEENVYDKIYIGETTTDIIDENELDSLMVKVFNCTKE